MNPAAIPGGHFYDNPGASAPVLAGGKMWMAAVTGRLYCLDPATGAPCATASFDIGLSSGLHTMDIVTHGTRIFVSRQDGAVACFDVASSGPCAGWATPKDFSGDYNLINQYDSVGTATGVCVISSSGSDGTCVKDADPGTTTAISNFPLTDTYYSFTQEAETGTRTLVGSLSHSGLGCWDWTTLQPCTGGGYGADGWLLVDKDGNSLPNAYGTVFDGACAIALGDPGRVYTVDPGGTSPCTSLRSGSGTKAVDLRRQRCDNVVGGARWKSVVLTDSDGGELDSLVVTVRDAQTGAVVATGDLIAGALDLSGVDPGQHPALIVDGSAQAKNATEPWDDGIPPRIVLSWTPDPRELCIRTRGSAECSPAGLAQLGFAAHLATPARDAAASLGMARRACQSAYKLPRCKSRRRFRITVRYRGTKIRKIRVTANGKRQKVLKLRPRPRVLINLRTRPKQRIVVRIRIRNKSGKLIKGKRVYHPCTKKLKGRRPPL